MKELRRPHTRCCPRNLSTRAMACQTPLLRTEPAPKLLLCMCKPKQSINIRVQHLLNLGGFPKKWWSPSGRRLSFRVPPHFSPTYASTDPLEKRQNLDTLSPRRCTGSDGLFPKDLSALSRCVVTVFAPMPNFYLFVAKFPGDWRRTIVTPVEKAVHKANSNLLSPVSPMPFVYNVLETTLKESMPTFGPYFPPNS